MYIDDSIVLNYIGGNDISKEWIFSNLIPGEIHYENPQISNEEIVYINNLIKENLLNFSPYNKDFFDDIFTNWREIYQEEMKFMLTVGCPYPFEAMVREKEGDLIIIFDLNRIFSDDLGQTKETVNRLITHEMFHILYEKTSYKPIVDYRDEMLNLVFNEGFAHYLSLNDKIMDDYASIRDKHYKKNMERLSIALEEKDKENQFSLLMEANANSFYDKFAPMVGLFILMDNEDRLREIFESGYENILSYALD